MEFSGITAGIKYYPENEFSKNADYVINISGDCMEPEYFNGDIVYVQKSKEDLKVLEKKDLEMIAEIMKEINKPINERLDKIDSRLDKMDSRLDQMDSRLNKLESKVTEIQIRIIAEGHLDLSRKLDDALKVENEKEMLLLRVTRLENELRRLKQKIEEIA